MHTNIVDDVLPYVVRAGDYLVKLAHLKAFDVDAVWNDPKNAELRALRKNHNLLAPGDIVYLPEPDTTALPLVGGSANQYTATIPVVSVSVRFKDSAGPLANTPFTADSGATPAEGTTDGDGGITLSVPVLVTSVHIDLPEHGLAYDVRVGNLDPVEEDSGIASRLAHLGYLMPPHLESLHADLKGAESAADRTRDAIMAFQTAQGLEATGVADTATRDALKSVHGS